MTERLLSFPLILVLAGLSCIAMLVPGIHALVVEDHSVARAFIYSSLLSLALLFMIGLAMSGRKRPDNTDIENLVSLALAYTLLPVLLAVPFYEGLETTLFLNAYVEMVSSLTTTGATLFTTPERLVDSLHLWRGVVGWLGGLLIWVAAAAVLAPMNLGGFELSVAAEPGQGDQSTFRFERASSSKRLSQVTTLLAPIYVGLTLILWLLLTAVGDPPLVSAMHAMATMSTSGISPIGGVSQSAGGFLPEVMIFAFMLFALSRTTFSSDAVSGQKTNPFMDPEFRIGAVLIIGVPLLLFFRHWLAAFEFEQEENFALALQALWGGLFTVLSFLSTTGFESASWQDARAWSGLGTPGIVLVGLAMIGGGVATTAGGVKLLRIYALYRNGKRELQRLAQPSSVGFTGGPNRRLHKRGAFFAWVFFMLFGLSLALVTVVMAALGQNLEDALVLAVASLSTTGPLTVVAVDTPIDLIEMSTTAKLVFSAAMVLGRLETLAVIALLNPSLWWD
ncbi:MAG: potassium transporter TrkG [Pseudomonadota bacterium]